MIEIYDEVCCLDIHSIKKNIASGSPIFCIPIGNFDFFSTNVSVIYEAWI